MARGQALWCNVHNKLSSCTILHTIHVHVLGAGPVVQCAQLSSWERSRSFTNCCLVIGQTVACPLFSFFLYFSLVPFARVCPFTPFFTVCPVPAHCIITKGSSRLRQSQSPTWLSLNTWTHVGTSDFPVAKALICAYNTEEWVENHLKGWNRGWWGSWELKWSEIGSTFWCRKWRGRRAVQSHTDEGPARKKACG